MILPSRPKYEPYGFVGNVITVAVLVVLVVTLVVCYNILPIN